MKNNNGTAKKNPAGSRASSAGVLASPRTIRELLSIKLRSLYDIESEIVKALPKMTAKATDPDLKQAFRDHLQETRVHVERIEQAFKVLGEKPRKLRVEAIRGLASDAVWIMQNVKDRKALDVNLIAAASYVEHYEMAGYISALAWARELGQGEVTRLLSATLDEEKTADHRLRDLASTKIDRLVPLVSEEEQTGRTITIS